MEYDNRPQIASILGEIEYIIELLYNAYNGPARNTLIERLRNLIRSMADLPHSLRCGRAHGRMWSRRRMSRLHSLRHCDLPPSSGRNLCA